MKILIVVDMQNDFINGTLGSKFAESIVNNVSNKIAIYKNAKFPVIFTRDTHTAEYLTTQEGRNLPIEHCIFNSEGWNISSNLDTKNSEVIDKPTFGSLDLPKVISKYKDIDEIELVGLCTDICVISNSLILKATFPEVKITVDASCCAGVTPESHKNALNAMKMCQINIENEEV